MSNSTLSTTHPADQRAAFPLAADRPEVNEQLQSYRALFPITERWTYLNHAACAALCRPSQERVAAYMAASGRDGVHSELEWWARVETARSKMAVLLGAEADEIAWVLNNSTALNCVAHGLAWERGDNVLVTAEQFPSNVYPWLQLQAEGVEVRVVPRRAGRVLLEDVAAALDGRTRLVTVSWVEFNSGFRQDLTALAALVHEQGALLCVDAMQGLGGLALDVRAAGVDFLTAGVHKWLLGPLGLGVFYVRRDRLEALRPRLANWRSVAEIMDFTNTGQPWLPSARRFEGGTPNLMGIIAFEAVLDLLLEIGPAVVEAQILALTDHLLAQLDAHGYEVITSRQPAERSGIVCFRSKSDEPAEAIVACLESAHISVAARMGLVRVSPHFYNTREEIERLFAPGLLG